LFFAAATLGWLAHLKGIRLPMAGLAYSFCLANIGFLIGVVKALAGRSIIAYEPSGPE
jgi:hydrogenase/urease accessory protein HupE